jgi:CIC family chloride channel protein
VFTPALFIGATLGGAYGVAMRQLLPGADLAPGALALVGMAGLVSGATHAPLTAIMMVFEMTGDYGLILPLMLTSVLAYGIARRLHPESIYTEWLVRRGVVLSHGADAAVLARLPVHECLNRQAVVIPEASSLPQIVASIGGSQQTEFPVVDADRRLVGMVTQATVREALEEGERLGTILLAADLAVPERDPLTSDDTLLTALRRLGGREVTLLPVVHPDDRERLEGTVSRHDVMAAYERALTAEGP